MEARSVIGDIRTLRDGAGLPTADFEVTVAAPREFSDEEVFGAAPRELTDAEVFGAPAPPPAAQPGALERGIGRPASIGVRNVAQGALGVLDMLNNAGGAVLNAPFAAYDALRGNAPGTSEPFRYGAIRRGVDAAMDAAGAARPETSAERLTGALVEGAAGTLTTLPGAQAVARLLPQGTARTVAEAVGSGAAVDAAAGAAGGVAQEAVSQAGGGDAEQLASSFGGGVLGGLLAQAVIASVMARRGRTPTGIAPGEQIMPDRSAVTPEEVSTVINDLDLRAVAEANGITPDDPRYTMLEARLAARRAAEARPNGAVAAQTAARGVPNAEALARGDRATNREVARERRLADFEAERPAMPPEQTPPRPDVMAVTPDGQAFPADPGTETGRRMRADPGPDRFSDVPSVGGATPETVQGYRLRGIPDQEIAQSAQAFDQAAARRQRVADPAMRDDRAGTATPEGPQQVQVLLDQGFPVRMLEDLGGGVVRVQRFDPRTGAPEAGAEPYAMNRADLTVRNYTLDPRAAQDFQGASRGPARSGADLNLPRQTFRTTEPDPNENFPGATRPGPGDGEPPMGRSPFPEQPEGSARAREGSRSEQRYRDAEEALRDFARRQQERAERQRASGDAGPRASGEYTERTSNRAAPVGEDGRYPTDPAGNVRSAEGGAIRFGDQKQAARWIISEGQKNSRDQVFEIANHPAGSGFTARVRGFTEPPQADAGSRGAGDAASPPPPRGEDPASAPAAEPPRLNAPEGGDTPIYTNPVTDPSAWRRFVGEPLAATIRGIVNDTQGAANLFRWLTYTADSELRARPSAQRSATFRAELDGLFARAGEDASAGRTFDEAVFAETNRNLIRVQRIEDAVKAAGVDAADLRAAVTGGRPAKPVPAALVQQVRTLLADLHRMQTDAGVDIGNAGPRYFPREIDTGAVFKNDGSEQRFFQKIVAEYQRADGPGLSAKAAQEAATMLLTAMKARADGATLDGQPVGRGNAMNTKSREFAPGADQRLADFYVTDVPRVLGLYTLRAVKRAEIARRFGEPVPTTNGVTLPKLDERMAQMQQEGATSGDLEALRHYVGIATGVSIPRTPRALDWLRTWATVGNLNASSIINLSETLMPAVRAGNLGGTFKDLARVVRQFQREVRKMPRDDRATLAERLGVIAGREHNAIMQARFGAGEISDRLAARVQTGFFRAIGMEQLTTAIRVASAERGIEFIRDMSLAATGDRKFLGLFGDQNRARFFLRELGVPRGKEDDFARFVREHHNADYPSQVLNTEAGRMWQTAVGRFVDQTSMRPSVSTRPRWAASPVGSILFNLSSYPYAFGKNVIGRAVGLGTEGVTGKGYSPVERLALLAPILLPLAAFSAASVALFAARDDITGDPSVEKRKTDNRRFQDMVDASNLTGGAGPWINLLTAGVGGYQGGFTQQAAGPVMGMPLGLVEALGGYLSVRNSPNTNTSERALARSTYRSVVEPGVNMAASLLPGGIARTGVIIGTSLPAVRDTFVDEVAGPQSPRARRATQRQPIYGLGDAVMEPTRRGVPIRQ